MFALLTTFMLAAAAPTQPASRSQFPPVPQNVIEALDNYRNSIFSHCVPKDAAEQHDSISSVLRLRPELGRDLAAMRSYYNNDFVEHGPTLVTAPPPFCLTPEEFKLSEDRERSALDRLTRTLVDHGVLPIS